MASAGAIVEAVRLTEKDLHDALAGLEQVRAERDVMNAHWNPVGKTVDERDEHSRQRASLSEREYSLRKVIGRLTRQHVMLQDTLALRD